MKVLIIVVVAIVGLTSALPQAPPAALAKQPDFICVNGMMTPNPTVGAGIVKCKTEAKNPKCEYFCVAKLLNLLEDNGLPSRSTYARWTKDTFPESLQEKSLKHFSDCMEKHGDKVTLDDDTCEEVSKLNDCTWSLAPQLTC